ncbi:YcaO-like family protein [Streptomyces pratens]|uniref:YcaO-like family protein n=1 Tax=Streptomyces pratens TaxID=887456 RepID=A0ABW1LSC8_9ACTN
MIDIPATLAPASGVALRYAVTPPHADDPLWSSAVALQPVEGLKTPETDLPLSARFAGASGPSRLDALLRGAGEAVERRALHPSAGHPARYGTAMQQDAPTLFSDYPDHALCHEDAVTTAMSWYEARDLHTDTPVLVPADLVDWPTPSAHPTLFDPSPSGAAAGESYEAALGAAMVEVVERDAFTVAWGRQLRLPTYEPSPENTSLLEMQRRAQREGITPVLARIPTALPDLWCMTACLIDPDVPGALATVGMKASTDPAQASLKAFQEAWQVRAALRALRAQGESGLSGPIMTEHDRLCHMLNRPAYEAVCDWVADFQEPALLPAESPTGLHPLVEKLRHALAADGATPLAIELTPRLPMAVTSMGWCVVKVLAPGYQSLRMDESHQWSWHMPRLASASRRTGCHARLDNPLDSAPHPLP